MQAALVAVGKVSLYKDFKFRIKSEKRGCLKKHPLFINNAATFYFAEISTLRLIKLVKSAPVSMP